MPFNENRPQNRNGPLTYWPCPGKSLYHPDFCLDHPLKPPNSQNETQNTLSVQSRNSTCRSQLIQAVTHLYEQRHLWLLHWLNGRLHQRHRGLQVVVLQTDERPKVSEFVVLLPGDQPHQLLLPLLQDGHQAVETAGQLFSLPLTVLLKWGREGENYSPGIQIQIQIQNIWSVSVSLYVCVSDLCGAADLFHLGDDCLDVVVAGDQHGDAVAQLRLQANKTPKFPWNLQN